MGWDGIGLKNLNTSPPLGEGLKSQPIIVPPPLRGQENPRKVKWGEPKLPSRFTHVTT